jgi:hypothetical protein
VTASKDSSGSIAVTFPYDPQLVEKVRTIEGRRWHSFPLVIVRGEAPKQSQGYYSKTTEIYTHVNIKSLGRIKSPLDSINLTKRGDE